MKNLKNIILEKFTLQNLNDDVYVLMELILNDVQSDAYLSKCLHETYKDRQLIIRGDYGIKFYMYVLNIREIKNCYSEYVKSFKDKEKYGLTVWKIDGELNDLNNVTDKDIKEYIKKHTDDEYNSILKNRIKANIVRK